MGSQNGAEGAVSRVGQIGVAVGFTLESDKEAVGKAVGLAFDADISAPFKGVDGVDLAREGTEGGLNLLYLFRRRVIFEFEEDDVT